MRIRLILCLVLASTLLSTGCAGTGRNPGTERRLFAAAPSNSGPQSEVGWTLDFPKAFP